MLDAFDLGFIQSGEYVFMDVWLFPFPGQYWGNHDWLRNDLRDQDAKLAYESLFRISLQVPTSVEWKNFTNDVKLLALSKYGFNFTNEEVSMTVEITMLKIRDTMYLTQMILFLYPYCPM